MEDWWIWCSPDLVHWQHECTLKPEQTYMGAGFSSCWATDAIERDGKYYWYLSEKNRATGVVVGDSPTGPWHDPLGRPLVGPEINADGAYDPGVFRDDDGNYYLVFGVWDFYIARLADDMVSFAEEPRKVAIHNQESHYGKGKTDDKPYLHRRDDVYYLSWGCYYGVAEDIYGPYDCRGSVIVEERVDPELRYDDRHIGWDRHGCFFEWKDQWYFACNDQSQTGSTRFRDFSIAYLNYRDNGEMEPVRLTTDGVRPPDGVLHCPEK
jgi:beta-xylosidase